MYECAFKNNHRVFVLRIFFILVLLAPVHVVSFQTVNDNLIWNEGNIEVTSEISPYESIQANQPISGTVMITHDKNDSIDTSSFRMGDQRLKVKLVQSAVMATNKKLVVTIYNFQMEGKPSGVYTLPPIRVRVAGKEYQARSLVLNVP